MVDDPNILKACRKGDANTKTITVGHSAVRMLADASEIAGLPSSEHNGGIEPRLALRLRENPQVMLPTRGFRISRVPRNLFHAVLWMGRQPIADRGLAEPVLDKVDPCGLEHLVASPLESGH